MLSTYINTKRFTAVESKGRKSGIMGYDGNVGYRMEWPGGRKKNQVWYEKVGWYAEGMARGEG